MPCNHLAHLNADLPSQKFRTSLGYFIAMDSFIVLPPAAFLAVNYITYGRLIRSCVGREHSFLRPERVGRTFVLSDTLTFLIQVIPCVFCHK